MYNITYDEFLCILRNSSTLIRLVTQKEICNYKFVCLYMDGCTSLFNFLIFSTWNVSLFIFQSLCRWFPRLLSFWHLLRLCCLYIGKYQTNCWWTFSRIGFKNTHVFRLSAIIFNLQYKKFKIFGFIFIYCQYFTFCG